MWVCTRRFDGIPETAVVVGEPGKALRPPLASGRRDGARALSYARFATAWKPPPPPGAHYGRSKRYWLGAFGIPW
jgi:hypothetical protein